MRYREGLRTRDYVGLSAAGLGFAGLLALTAGCSGQASRSPAPLPTATTSAAPREGCLEITATIEGVANSGATTVELGLVAIWGTGTTAKGERFTFRRLQPNPHGPGSYSQTPLIPISQEGVLPSILHTFPPTAVPEKFLVTGEVATGNGRTLTGPQCELEFTVVPFNVPQGPQPSTALAAALGVAAETR